MQLAQHQGWEYASVKWETKEVTECKECTMANETI